MPPTYNLRKKHNKAIKYPPDCTEYTDTSHYFETPKQPLGPAERDAMAKANQQGCTKTSPFKFICTQSNLGSNFSVLNKGFKKRLEILLCACVCMCSLSFYLRIVSGVYWLYSVKRDINTEEPNWEG
jgi:hypothetical protein